MGSLFVGRQPILDVQGELYSFELLYRNSSSNVFPNINPEVATIKVIINTFLSPGFEQLAAKKTFINFSERLLVTNIFDALNPRQVVIEVLEHVKLNDEIVRQFKRLRSKGFQIALDDFVLEREHIEYPELFELVNYIKVDFLATTKAERISVEMLKSMYPHIILLAEKVETKEQFEEAKKAGYELFQGYFFAKPEVLESGMLPTDVLHYFELLRLLNNENTSVNQIARVVMRDVSLAYRILRQTNTYAYQSLKKISSIRQAIVRIGLIELRRWVQFLAVYEEGTKEASGRNKVLISNSLVRANLCELLSLEKGKHDADEYYVLGLFSLIDLILKRDSVEMFTSLPVSTKIIETLCGVETEMTPYLKIAKALEKMQFERAMELAEEIGIGKETLSKLLLRAVASV